MPTKAKPSFLRLFLSGFTIGAVAMVSFGTLHAEDAAMIPAAQAATR